MSDGNGHFMVHRIPDTRLIGDRAGFIARACENRSVLHLGCAEWPTTAESLRDGTLLHLAVASAARRALGVDLSEEGLAILRASGFRDVVRWDVEKLSELELDRPVDVIVAGEILEHLSNPGLCLAGAAQIMKQAGAILILSVPNAFSLRHFLPLLLRRTELVMPDHTAYYSITTLSELLGRYGLRIREIHMCMNGAGKSSRIVRSLKRVLTGTLFQLYPQVSEGILVVAENDSSDGRRAEMARRQPQ